MIAGRLLNSKRTLRVQLTQPKYSNFSGQAMVSFSYDDGHISNYQYAFPLHLQYDIPASFNIVSDDVGDLSVMDAEQLKKSDNKGFEVASHSKTHPLLSNGKMFSELTEVETIDELNLSKIALQNLGLSRIEGFVVPGSKLADWQVPLIAQYYQYSRCWHGRNDDVNAQVESSTNPPLISYPMKDFYNIPSYDVTSATTTDNLISLIDQAVTNKRYIIFMMHAISNGIEVDSYSWDKAKLETVLSYIKTITKDKLLPINMRDGIRFASGLGDY